MKLGTFQYLGHPSNHYAPSLCDHILGLSGPSSILSFSCSVLSKEVFYSDLFIYIYINRFLFLKKMNYTITPCLIVHVVVLSGLALCSGVCLMSGIWTPVSRVKVQHLNHYTKDTLLQGQILHFGGHIVLRQKWTFFWFKHQTRYNAALHRSRLSLTSTGSRNSKI